MLARHLRYVAAQSDCQAKRNVHKGFAKDAEDFSARLGEMTHPNTEMPANRESSQRAGVDYAWHAECSRQVEEASRSRNKCAFT
jgi:hypothetical protein